MSNCTRKNGFCDNLECENCLSRSFASSNRVDNLMPGQGDPRRIPIRGGKLLKFKCGECAHEFEAKGDKVNSIGKTKPTWCPYCGNKQLCKSDTCITCYNKSFASFEKKDIVACFARDNTDKDGKTIVTPRDIFLYSNMKMKFTCNVCDHDLYSKVSNVVSLDRWCKYCETQGFCEDIECQKCIDRSIASFPRALKCWSPKNGDIDPRRVAKGSPTHKYWFDCDMCPHSFEADPGHITNPNACTWCPYCSTPPRKLCGKDDSETTCQTCYDKSFAAHRMAKYWSPKNTIMPHQIHKGADAKCWFDCNECEKSFEAALFHITNPSDPRWCPYCKNKTEAKLFEWLNDRYPSSFSMHKRYSWLFKDRSSYEYDFVCEKAKLIIELDGDQHFKFVKCWKTPLEVIEGRDFFKMEKAKEYGYSMIRLLQQDVYYDRNDWKTLLEENIKKYDEPTFIFLSDNKCYDKMKKLSFLNE